MKTHKVCYKLIDHTSRKICELCYIVFMTNVPDKFTQWIETGDNERDTSNFLAWTNAESFLKMNLWTQVEREVKKNYPLDDFILKERCCRCEMGMANLSLKPRDPKHMTTTKCMEFCECCYEKGCCQENINTIQHKYHTKKCVMVYTFDVMTGNLHPEPSGQVEQHMDKSTYDCPDAYDDVRAHHMMRPEGHDMRQRGGARSQSSKSQTRNHQNSKRRSTNYDQL